MYKKPFHTCNFGGIPLLNWSVGGNRKCEYFSNEKVGNSMGRSGC
jgi:hypothetical protein